MGRERDRPVGDLDGEDLDGAEVEAVRALTRMARLLERRAGGLGLAHYRVLAAVAAGDARASRVAARLALGKPTISASVEALCRRGLLARTDDAGDQRAVRLALTPQGRDLLRQVEGDMTDTLRRLAERTDRPAELVASLVALGRAIDETWAEMAPGSQAGATGAGPPHGSGP